MDERLTKIAKIAHEGGLLGLSAYDALDEIRLLTIPEYEAIKNARATASNSQSAPCPCSKDHALLKSEIGYNYCSVCGTKL